MRFSISSTLRISYDEKDYLMTNFIQNRLAMVGTAAAVALVSVSSFKHADVAVQSPSSSANHATVGTNSMLGSGRSLLVKSAYRPDQTNAVHGYPGV